MTLRTLVVGCGHIAQQHFAALAEFGAHRTTMACDLSPSLAQASFERFGLSGWSTQFEDALDRFRPEIVHVATPATTHVPLASLALRSGAHVFVEKPIALSLDELSDLQSLASQSGRVLIEDHNYRFNPPVDAILQQVRTGNFGEVRHLEIYMALDILGKGSVFTDLNLPHPSVRYPGGAVSDFVSHFAYLTGAFLGAHKSVKVSWQKYSEAPLPCDEFRAFIECQGGTATLGFSATSQPDTFDVQVYGTKMSARASLFETRLAQARIRSGIRPLTPLLNGLADGLSTIRSSLSSMKSKVAGKAGSYQGLWNLIRRVHESIIEGASPPVSANDILIANHLVADMLAGAPRL